MLHPYWHCGLHIGGVSLQVVPGFSEECSNYHSYTLYQRFWSLRYRILYSVMNYQIVLLSECLYIHINVCTCTRKASYQSHTIICTGRQTEPNMAPSNHICQSQRLADQIFRCRAIFGSITLKPYKGNELSIGGCWRLDALALSCLLLEGDLHDYPVSVTCMTIL